MKKYAKIIDENSGLCDVGFGTNETFYNSIGMSLLDVEQSDVDNGWYITEKCPHKSEEEKERQERERLDSLTLTPADVERTLYKAKQMDFEDLKTLIAEQIPTVDIKGLAIEFRAKDFYRGAVANGMRLFDVVGALLEYTPQDMDYLFEHKELPVKEDEDV